MSKKKQHPEVLISAIHATFNGYPLSDDQQDALEEFEQTKSLDKITVDKEAMQNLEEGVDERARAVWAVLEKEINENHSSTTNGQMEQVKVWRMFPMKIAAAILILVICCVAFFFINKWSNTTGKAVRMVGTDNFDLPAGTEKATLLLSGNNPKILTSAIQGVIAKDGGITIENNVDGKIAYEIKPGEKVRSGTNSLVTPRAGTYQVELSDGTIIHVNAESTVEYPTSFTDSIRLVTLKRGEAYFDVAPDVNKPFIVRTSNYDLRVLGTQFNVNTYADEGLIKTTLIKGNVLLKADRLYDLKVNQQAVFSQKDNKIQILDNADVQGAISWKDGYFRFSRLDLRTIMTQVARWYDINEVVIENEERWAHEPFTVHRIPRSFTLREFLTALSGDTFQFEISEDKKVTIR